MWQRIQTVFLALTAILMLLVVFLPIWEKSSPEGEYLVISAIQMQHIKDNIEVAGHNQPTAYLAVLAVLAALVSIYNILSYKKRLLQIKLAALSNLLITLFVGVTFYWIYTADAWFSPPAHGDYLAGAYLPLLALLCNMLAIRGIKKDEALVRSMDRLR
ncbi:MAG: DUF4293 domain-containing protein [Bernardetiaceae bacterium]